MRRTYFCLAAVGLSPLLALVVWRASSGQAPGTAPEKGAAPLPPLTQVVLFNSGIGYFQREGSVEGDARLEMSFPVADVNDLLKTLTIDDGGTPAGVSIDSSEPLHETLANFSVDLATNPTYGELLNQLRGEKVELSVEGGPGVSSTTLTGTVVGMEAHFEGSPPKEVHHLNLLTSDGARRLPLARVTRVRLLDPRMDEDFRRALAALAGGRGNQRRRVTAHLSGVGKRTVKIAHVAETPIWKASYRLDLNAKGNKAGLVTHAVVENTTESDWKDVRLVLVSGRPITFQMDLARSLFVPRPSLEPRYYASLRPPEHATMPGLGGVNLGVGGGQVGVLGGGAHGALGGVQLGGGMQLGRGPLTPIDVEKSDGGMRYSFDPTYNRYKYALPRDPGARRLSYAELLARRDQQVQTKARERAAAMDHGSLITRQEGIESIAVDADRIGEAFRHAVERKVTVPRQKSALLPVQESAVEVARVSVYNRLVHPFFPMSSLKVKNTTNQHLLQGPVAVRDEGLYAGDAKLPDLQPGQERLISYAMDLGQEVRPEDRIGLESSRILSLEEGQVQMRETRRGTTVYRITNRSKMDRRLLLEHPRRKGWVLVETEKPAGQNDQLYRFEWAVPAGKPLERTITEENVTTTWTSLDRSSTQLKALAKTPDTPERIAKVLLELAGRKVKEEKLAAELAELGAKLKPLLEEEERLRTNLTALPKESAATKRVVERFDKVEEQVVKIKDQMTQKSDARRKLVEDYAAHIETLNVK